MQVSNPRQPLSFSSVDFWRLSYQNAKRQYAMRYLTPYFLCLFIAHYLEIAYGQNDTTVDREICQGITVTGQREKKHLWCYACEGTVSDEADDPLCDQKVFRYGMPGQRLRNRRRCLGLDGYWCFKNVSRGSRERLTVRGCLNKTIDIPTRVGNRTKIGEDGGCITYLSERSRYVVTTCVCKGDLCNSGTIGSGYSALLLVSLGALFRLQRSFRHYWVL